MIPQTPTHEILEFNQYDGIKQPYDTYTKLNSLVFRQGKQKALTDMPHSPIDSNLVDKQNRFSLAVNRDTVLFTSKNKEKHEAWFKSLIN